MRMYRVGFGDFFLLLLCRRRGLIVELLQMPPDPCQHFQLAVLKIGVHLLTGRDDNRFAGLQRKIRSDRCRYVAVKHIWVKNPTSNSRSIFIS